MSTLWVYGCSFSEPIILCNNSFFSEDGTLNHFDVDYWGTHLAKKLGFNCVTKSRSGIGWNYISHRIEQDIIKWSTDDIIIISPSFFHRTTILEFKDELTAEFNIFTECSHLLSPIEQIIQYNKERWYLKIKTLQHLNFKVFTWIVDEIANDVTDLNNLILTPDKDINWKDWMDRHHELWIDPANNDWHFNKQGHIKVAETMYDFIKDKI